MKHGKKPLAFVGGIGIVLTCVVWLLWQWAFGMSDIEIHDPERLFAEAQRLPEVFQLAAAEEELIWLRESSDWSNVQAKIPKAIKELHPIGVYLSHHIILIILDGGGIAGYDGIGIFLEKSGCNFPQIEKKYRLKALDRPRRIYQFALYDFSILIDVCHP